MTTPEAPTLSVPQAIMTDATDKMKEKFIASHADMTPNHERIALKLRSVFIWWPICALGIFADWQVIHNAMTTKDRPSTILLLIELAVPTLVSFFAAFKADTEGTGAILSSIITLGRNARKAFKETNESS